MPLFALWIHILNRTAIHQEMADAEKERGKRQMAFNKDEVFDYIATADSWINLNDALGGINIRELTEPLINSINDEGSVSYILEVPQRYRASTTATVLDALADVNLLPTNAIKQMQDHLYTLRDNFVPLSAADDRIDKATEDRDAWGIDEAPSVWTTSKVVIALMTTHFAQRDNFSLKQRGELRDSVYWLAEQAYDDGGWGYQKFQASAACQSSVPMTALAMKAILLAQSDNVLFNEDARRNRRFNRISRALTNGKEYLLRNLTETDDGNAYWKYMDKPGIAVSMWALDALKLLTTDGRYLQFGEQYSVLEKKVLKYVYANLPEQQSLDTYKPSELFFVATVNDGLKYKPNLVIDKRFYTFVPYIVSSLLDRGEDPLNPKIITMVRWLLRNRTQHWAIQEYNVSAPCSISAAMAINVIVKWLKKVSQNSFSRSVTALISERADTSHCQYGFRCTRPRADERKKVARAFLLPMTVALAAMIFLRIVTPTTKEIQTAVWLLSVFVCAILMNTKRIKDIASEIYRRKKNVSWEIVLVVIGMLVTWLVGTILSLVGSLLNLIWG